MSGPTGATGFAPTDPTDGRGLVEWKSRYSDPEAKRSIHCEAWYLGALLFLAPIAILVFWLDAPRAFFGLPENKSTIIARYGVAWAAGTLGGTLFNLKWLYHVVARGIWNMDRRLWRIFTPHISGALAFALTALMSSGILTLFNKEASSSFSFVVGFSFIAGYFSDNAIAKLSELAETLFGSTRNKGGQNSGTVEPLKRKASD